MLQLQNDFKVFDYLEEAETSNTAISSILKELGYDSVRGVQMAFDPAQLKSADPVTYDDNGNVIPLRFNSENEDIRYSIGSPSQQLRYNPERYGEWLKRRYNSSADIESLTEKIDRSRKTV